MRRAQVSFFVVVGLLVFAWAGLALLARSPVSGAQADTGSASQAALFVKDYVDGCLEEKAFEAVQLGLSDSVRESQEFLVSDGLRQCLGSAVFGMQGVKVVSGEPVVHVYSGRVFVVEAEFPVVISSGSFSSRLSRFSTQVWLDSSARLSQSGDSVVVSSDRKAELGVVAGSARGNAALGEVGLSISEKPLSASDEVVVGNIVYGVFPVASFEPKALLSISYSDSGLPVSEEALAVAFFDSVSGSWIRLDSVVDSSRNVVSAHVSRSGLFAVVYSGIGEGFPEDRSVYESQPVPVPSPQEPVQPEPDFVPELENCFRGRLAVFPVKGAVSFMNDWGFGRVQGRHEGTDIMAPDGSGIVAAVSGVVHDRYCSTLGGNAFEIRSDDGVVYYYAHMSSFGRFRKGDRVRAGDVLGYVGTTIGCMGCAEGLCGIPGRTVPHLHFGIYVDTNAKWKAQNPYCSLLDAQRRQGLS
ncbi:M23 family metallopeptidase [Candidatus Woesearchaeota archaeon]|nr:M23 family metallopeptidase [Candidatus Woesearchaeota archaeon]